MASVRRDAISGLVVVGPLAVTLLALLFLFRLIAGAPFVAWIEPAVLRVPAALVVGVLVVLLTGQFMRTAFGTVVNDAVGDVINHIPGIRVVYNASELAVETALSSGEERTEPIKFEAWSGLRVTAFYTGNRTEDGRLLCFFPTAPNITTGYVIEVEEADVEFTGESIEQALIRILSAGLGEPDHPSAEDVIAPSGQARYVRNVDLPALESR